MPTKAEKCVALSRPALLPQSPYLDCLIPTATDNNQLRKADGNGINFFRMPSEGTPKYSAPITMPLAQSFTVLKLVLGDRNGSVT